jgi:hypothetical protein
MEIMKKTEPSLIGLWQALAVVAYCALAVGFMHLANEFFNRPGYLGSVLILTLLVFSAAISGAIVFGYPAYLVLNKKVKEGLSVFTYTLLYCLGLIAIILIVLFVLQ